MMWNPLDAIRKKLAGSPAAPAPPQSPRAPGETAVPGGLAELEQQGLLSKFFRHWKSPAFLKQLKAAAVRMQAEGVDIKDRKAVQAWLEKHREDLESGKLEAAGGPKPETFVKTGPDVGRNDPCPCGSGKKSKKCCEGRK